jgi:TRAP transporter TAXI family solute receptor
MKRMIPIGAGAIALLLAPVATAEGIPKRLVFSSYDFGSSGFAQASGIANAFKTKYGSRIRIIPSGTSIGRILPLTQGKVDYAFLASGTLFSSEGTYDFATQQWGPQDLRVLLAPPAATGWVTLGNSKFKDAKSIKGIRVGYVKGNPSVNVKNDGILAYAGLTRADIKEVWFGGYGVMKSALITGKIDTFLSSPSSGITREIEASPNSVGWVEFDPKDAPRWKNMQKIAPMYAPLRLTIGAGMSESNPKDILSFRYPMMVTYANRADAEVYNMIKAMDETYDMYKDVSSAAKWWDIKYSGKPPSEAAWHPAAVRYLKEKGVWTADSEAWNNARLKRQASVIAAWDDAMDAFNDYRAAERKKKNKIKAADVWPKYWTDWRKKVGLD